MVCLRMCAHMKARRPGTGQKKLDQDLNLGSFQGCGVMPSYKCSVVRTKSQFHPVLSAISATRANSNVWSRSTDRLLCFKVGVAGFFRS